jgi:hypothetical protein
MSEKPESDDFDEDDADDVSDAGDDVDFDFIIKNLDSQKRRGGPRRDEPAWRRLEKLAEQKRTAELLSDFDDYDIGDEGDSAAGGRRGGRKKKHQR